MSVKYVVELEHPVMTVEETKIFTANQRTPRLVLADGTSMSVQYHWSSYCSPRPEVEEKVSSSVSVLSAEIGFPSREISEIMEYAEDRENPTDTVYGYVPVRLINSVIAAAGGIVRFESYCPIVVNEGN